MAHVSRWAVPALVTFLSFGCSSDSHVLATAAPGTGGGPSAPDGGGGTGGTGGSSGMPSANGGASTASTGGAPGCTPACNAPETCGGTGTPGVCGTPTHDCGMQLNESPVAFCETFDQPNPIFNRS